MTHRKRKFAAMAVGFLSVIAALLISSVGICSRRVDRSRYQPMLSSLQVGQRAERVIGELEAQGCLRLSKQEHLVTYECLPASDCPCKYIPTMVDGVNLKVVDGTVTSVEKFDGISLLPKPDRSR